MSKKYGWIKDKQDHRDLKFSFSPRELPLSFDLRNTSFKILDQGDIGSCTANAISSAYRFNHLKQKLNEFNPSRLFIYYNERVIEGTVMKDCGAMIRSGFKSINKQGICKEEIWKYSTWKYACKPSKVCYEEALKDQVIEYLSLDQTPSQLKGCIADGFPFVFGFAVYPSFDNIDKSGIMPMPAPYEIPDGGHAVLCVGYDKDYFIIQNSWGVGWGDKGFFYMPKEYIYSNLCADFWTIRTVE